MKKKNDQTENTKILNTNVLKTVNDNGCQCVAPESTI